MFAVTLDLETVKIHLRRALAEAIFLPLEGFGALWGLFGALWGSRRAFEGFQGGPEAKKSSKRRSWERKKVVQERS